MSGNNSFFSGIYFPDLALSFLALLFEGVPFLLLGAFFSGLVDFLLPIGQLKRKLPQSKIGGLITAMAAGFFLPLCECSSVAVARRLIRRGLPLSMVLTYLLASPLFNPFTILSTYLAFRTQHPWRMVFLRLGTGGVIVFFLGLWIGKRSPEEILNPQVLLKPGEEMDLLKTETAIRPKAPLPAFQRFTFLIMRDFLSIAPYFVMGAACAAYFSLGVQREALAVFGKNIFLGPASAIFLAQILCLCSTADAFVIATFSSFSVPAKIAFLVAGPLFDFKLYWLYQSLLQRRLIYGLWWRMLVGVLGLTIFYGVIFRY